MSNLGTNAVRSPSYPNMALADAIASVRKIESQYRTAQVDRIAGAKILGYSGLSGPANQALAALAQYGLVERAGKGEMRVTARALAILHPNSENERLQNLRMAAMEPNLFRELGERFPNIVPPEDGVMTYLNRQGFNQNAIRPATKAYLQTLLFLEESGVSESHGVEESNVPNESDRSPDQESTVHNLTAQPITAVGGVVPQIAFSNTLPDGAVNLINMNIQGKTVHISGVFDYAGLAKLEKKIASLKALMEPEDELGYDENSGL